jgi:hypothetical protein
LKRDLKHTGPVSRRKAKIIRIEIKKLEKWMMHDTLYRDRPFGLASLSESRGFSKLRQPVKTIKVRVRNGMSGIDSLSPELVTSGVQRLSYFVRSSYVAEGPGLEGPAFPFS